MPLEAFSPPAFLEDLNPQQKQAWSDWISQQFDEAQAGNTDLFDFDAPRAQFFNPRRVELAEDRATLDIAWTGFPRNVAVTSVGERQRWRRADSSRDVQDEYCEWSVARDPNSRKITRVAFTCEGPEYWSFLANTAPEVALALYREFINPDVQREDLFDEDGTYIPRNKWNSTTTNGAMHLIQVNNSLSAEIELAAGSSVVRKIGGRLLAEARELIDCGRYGGRERHSDPHIGERVNSLTRQKADVTLEDPVGLYFNDLLTTGWQTPDGTDPKTFWKYVRGQRGKFVRAVYEVPPEKNYVVGDVTINGRPIEFGAQIADFISIKLTGVAHRFGQSTVEPMTGCRRRAEPGGGFESAPVVSVEAVIGRSARPTRISPEPHREPQTTTPRMEESAPRAGELSSSVEFLKAPTVVDARGPGGFESVADNLAVEPKAAALGSRLRGLTRLGVLPETDLDSLRNMPQGGLEVIIGVNNLLPAVFLELGVRTSRSVCLVNASGVDFLGRRGSWKGTGILLSPNILLTNHHVLNSVQVAGTAECVFNFQAGADGRLQQTRTFRCRPQRLFITSPATGSGLDYTFVWVDGEPGNEFGFVPIDRRAFEIVVDEFANVLSHPAGRPKSVSLQENQVKHQDELIVHYTSDTEPGSSGAGVFNNSWSLVALHHAAKPSQVPGFEFLNEGIKLSAIATSLERQAQGGQQQAAAQEVLRLFGGSDEAMGFFGSLGRRGRADNSLEAVVDSYQGEADDIDVAFWNVEWLSNRYEEKVSAVAEAIFRMNLDIWALEESSPNAAKALVKELKNVYGLEFQYEPAEPDAPDNKQSCTVLWNSKTVRGERRAWGEPIETWLGTHSRDFDELGFEAVEGRIFDRYPVLMHFEALNRPETAPFHFFLVPLHLKAKDEGSKRRRMAARILAEAVRKKIEDDVDADWVLGGDYNAELESGDFQALSQGGFTPLSAGDEQADAISYVKQPFRSLIDHIFLSPNLAAQYDEGDFFIVAADRTIPDYVSEVSDHRPVLVRLSLGEAGTAPGGEEGGLESAGEAAAPSAAALNELKQRLGALPHVPPSAAEPAPPEGSFERRQRRRRPARPQVGGQAADYRDRDGYLANFLGGGQQRVPLFGLPDGAENDAVVVDRRAADLERFVLRYTHFSVVVNGARKMPYYSAVNIDGAELRRIPRSDDKWVFDPRIPQQSQTGDAVYKNNDLDRGHMTRRLDPVWGPSSVAALADADTFHFTNACPQHKNLNQKEWLQLEDYVLGSSENHDSKVSVFTGPVLHPSDRRYRGIQLPEEFWKVVVMVRADTNQLSATGYLLTQKDMISGFEFVFGQFKTYQVTLRRVEELTGLKLGDLLNFDPLMRARPEALGLEAAAAGAQLITGPESLVL